LKRTRGTAHGGWCLKVERNRDSGG
jgi:hypothetical protein